MYFLFEDAYLLEKYNTIWDKVSAHGDKVTDFYDNKIPKVDSSKKNENYYPQAFLKEPKYIERNKIIRQIHDNLSDVAYPSDEYDKE